MEEGANEAASWLSGTWDQKPLGSPPLGDVQDARLNTCVLLERKDEKLALSD